MAPRMTRARAAAQAAMVDIRVDEQDVASSTSASESIASSPERQSRPALKVVTGNTGPSGEEESNFRRKTRRRSRTGKKAQKEKETVERDTEDEQDVHEDEDKVVEEIDSVAEHDTRPMEGALNESDDKSSDAAYFPDYEHGSPVRRAPDTAAIDPNIKPDDTEKQSKALPKTTDDSTRTSLLASFEQLTIQNDYRPADDEDTAEASISEVLQVAATPLKSPLEDFKLECESTYTPASNTSDHDPYIPDYEASTIKSPTRSRFEHVEVQEEQLDESSPDDQAREGSSGATTNTEDAASSSGSSEAAQRLESLFSPIKPTGDSSTEGATFANLLSRPPSTVQDTVVDPIKALDALQDALDEVEQSIPTLAPSPQKVGVRFSVAPTLQTPQKHTRRDSRHAQRKSTPRAQDRQVHEFSLVSAAAKERSVISALHTPPAVAKSSKPVTKSSFQLPGEAIAAKLKAQREERLKKEEEEAKKRKEFKARPMLRSTKPVEVKATTTSKARISMMSSGTLKDASSVRLNMGTGRPSLPLNRGSTTATSRARNSTVRDRPAPHANATNARVKVAQPSNASLRKNSTMSSVPAMQQKKQASVLKTAARPSDVSTSASQKPTAGGKTAEPSKKVHASGAEVFKRPMLQKAAEEKALKEKVEAQKKARAEAAERSRQLSREFAEKKKASSKQSSRNVSGTSAAGGGDALAPVMTSAAVADV